MRELSIITFRGMRKAGETKGKIFKWSQATTVSQWRPWCKSIIPGTSGEKAVPIAQGQFSKH